jgi:hypothetical protein
MHTAHTLTARLPWIAGIVLVAMAAGSVFALTQVPSGVPVPIQYDLRGAPTRFATPLIAFGLIPFVTALSFVAERVFRGKAPRGKADAFIRLGVLVILAGAHAYLIARAVSL